MKRSISTIFAALAVAALALAPVPAAEAAPRDVSGKSSEGKASPEEMAELQALQRIAGQPVTYQQAPARAGSGQLRTMGLDPFVCVLYPSVVHLRSSSSQSTVGAKPYTKCTFGTPTSIQHTSVLYMVEWLGLSYVPLASKGQTGYNTRNMTLTSLEWRCNNGNNSTFVQKTNGSTVQNGRTYYSSVSTVKSVWGCGR